MKRYGRPDLIPIRKQKAQQSEKVSMWPQTFYLKKPSSLVVWEKKVFWMKMTVCGPKFFVWKSTNHFRSEKKKIF